MSQSIKSVRTLGPEHAGICLSSQEFADAEYAEPFRYERVKGRLVVMSPAELEHRSVSRPFRLELGGYWSQHRDTVDDVDIEGWVSTSPDDDRLPDICVYLAGAASSQHVPGRVPETIFQFASSNRADQERDYIDKRAKYHAIGVKEYVIVDRFKSAVLVLTWQPIDYQEKWLSVGDSYSTSLLPGLNIRLVDVF